MRSGRIVVTAAAALLLAALAGCAGGPDRSGDPAASAGPQGPAPRLRILLTDDDGWSAPGIVAVREALRRAGHAVVEVAPADDQSGVGAAVTVSGALAVGRPTPDPDVWSVGGTPADAAAVGLRSVMAASAPDLVVSGINSGHNVSRSAIHSGTVGAALTAVEFGVPAIAVSGPSATGPDPAAFAAAADFTARMVDTLARERGDGPLLPPGLVVNVNYPRVAPGARAAAVRAAPTADTPLVDLRYAPGPAGTLTPQVVMGGGDDPGDDAGVVAGSGVALTDLALDLEAPSPTFGVSARLAGLLTP